MSHFRVSNEAKLFPGNDGGSRGSWAHLVAAEVDTVDIAHAWQGQQSTLEGVKALDVVVRFAHLGCPGSPLFA